MRKIFFPRNNKLFTPLRIWVFFHLLVGILLGLFCIVRGPVRVNTALLDILPDSRGLKHAAAAEKIFSERAARNVYLFAGSADFTAARRAAAAVHDGFAASGTFESISLYLDENIMARLTGYLHALRYALLDADTRSLLENGRAREIADAALAEAFGAFNITGLDTIETDPFFLVGRKMKQFLSSSLLSSGSLSVRENVLAARYEGIWYVMIRGTLFPEGVSITNADSAVKKIYEACENIMARDPGLRFVYSGVPFHSYRSSLAAQNEISLITTISLVIIILGLLYFFRSPLPVLASVAAIGVSLFAAAGCVLIFFGEIHVITFIFGTTLIGTCVDYSIHYFVHRKWNTALAAGAEIRARIIRSITMSFISTAICYIALLFAPFMILRQFAVFSLAGLSSSFLTVMCLYPYLKNPGPQKRRPIRFPAIKISAGNLSAAKKILFLGSLIAASSFLFLNRSAVRVENNIADLYTPSGPLKESEKTAAGILNYGSSGRHFIVSGDNPEDLLRHEEVLTAELEKEIARSGLKSYMATSIFIPSVHTQKGNYTAAKKLLPFAERQFAYLGFPAEAAEIFRKDFAAAEGRYGIPGGDIPEYIHTLVSNLWIGEVGGRYYSCVLPLRAAGEDQFRIIADKLSFVTFINTVQDIGAELDSLTRIMAMLFLAAYIIISAVVCVCYPLRDTLKICAIPLLLVLVTVTVLVLRDISLGFFSVTGIILIFGLGLDYMFYTVESKRSSGGSLTVFAIVLSFATTALSFGALALSSFAPVHIFGLTVFTGLTTAFISALLMSGKTPN
jgi:predicted exporter